MFTASSFASAAYALLFNVVTAAVLLVVGWAVAGWSARFVARITERNERFDRTIANVLARLVRWTVLVITLIAVLGRFGVQTTSIVALLGAAGLAIGLALQGALSNVAAGVMILGLRPFRLGDAVDIGGTAGVVEEIGLFSTRLKTFDGVVVHQPNSNIWGAEIRNFSQAQLRRTDLIVGIGYDDDVGQALRIVQDLLNADERVLEDPATMVAVDSLGADSVNLLIRYWTVPGDLLTTKMELTRAVKEAFDAADIGIPFPQRDLHLIQSGPIEVKQAG